MTDDDSTLFVNINFDEALAPIREAAGREAHEAETASHYRSGGAEALEDFTVDESRVAQAADLEQGRGSSKGGRG